MKCLRDVMEGYFEQTALPAKMLKESMNNPIKPAACAWVVHESPERFYREYTFQNKAQVLSFITEVMKYEQQANHSGVQKIDDKIVSIEVYTHDINRITELDQEYARSVDFIYKDVLSFGL